MVLGIFAATGSPPRIGTVHVDVITAINRSRPYERTQTALEGGTPLTVHRRRANESMTISVVASDVPPVVGALLTGLWEFGHANRVRERMVQLQASFIEINVWTGTEFLRTPAGSLVWVIDDIAETTTAPEAGVYRATISLGESRRFATAFTSALPDVAPELAGATGGVADRGRQSAADVGSGTASSVAAGVTP